MAKIPAPIVETVPVEMIDLSRVSMIKTCDEAV